MTMIDPRALHPKDAKIPNPREEFDEQMASVKPLMRDVEDENGTGQTVALPNPPENVFAVCQIMHQNPQHLPIEFVGENKTPLLAVSPDENTMKVLTC